MAYSYTTYTGDGSTTQYAVPFGYIRREHVLATVATVAATFTWVNNSLIQMTTPPANGAAVRVYRLTPLAAPLVDFADGATLVAADLDTNALQSIYTQQELDDSLAGVALGAIPNGSKGDITTSVGGTVWTVNAGLPATRSTFTQSGSGATARTVDSKLKDVVSVKDFGAVGDGAADDTVAIQAALDAAAANGKDLFFPSGTYVIPAPATNNVAAILFPQSATLDIKVFGQGNKSTIKVTDSKLNSTSFCSIFGNTEGVSTAAGNGDVRGGYGTVIFEDLKILGTWDDTSTSRYGPNVFGFGLLDKFAMFKVELFEWPNKLCRVFNAKTYIADSCRIEFCASDGFRAVECSRCIVTNNTVKWCDDDAIALHTSTNASSAVPLRSEIVVTGNVIEDSEGIIVLGGKGVTISNNALSRTHGTCITVTSAPAGVPEGHNTMERIVIANNVIRDALTRCQSNGTFVTATVNTVGCIDVGGQPLGVNGSGVAPTRPDAGGAFLLPYGYYEARDGRTVAAVGSAGVSITGNVILRTIPSGGSNYSDLGFGPYRSMNGTLTAAVTEDAFKILGINVSGDISGLNIANNIVRGVSLAIYFQDVQSGRLVSDSRRGFENCLVQGNIISDCDQGFSHSNRSAPTPVNWDINFVGNLFDNDPYHKHVDRNTNGSWGSPGSVTLSCIGINILRISGCSTTGNVFKNCYQPILGDVTIAAIDESYAFGANTVFCDPVSITYSGSNKGVGVPSDGASFLHIIYDADPTSATYGDVTTVPKVSAGAPPSSGTFVQGLLVRRRNPVLLGGKVLFGWMRLTTGSNNVLDTDWAALYATNT